MLAATNDSISINLNFICNAKCDNFIADANDKSWEIFNVAVGPFEIDVLECAVLASGAYIFFDCSKWSADCAVDAMTRDDDAPFESEALTKRPLPKPNGLWVVERSKGIEKNDFGGIDRENVAGSGLLSDGYEFSAHEWSIFDDLRFAAHVWGVS